MRWQNPPKIINVGGVGVFAINANMEMEELDVREEDTRKMMDVLHIDIPSFYLDDDMSNYSITEEDNDLDKT